jgi:hypothetical protein
MKIGNNSGFNMTALLLAQNNRNQMTENKTNNNLPQAPPPSAWGRDYNSDKNLPTGLPQEYLEQRMKNLDPVFRANQFLHGIDGEEPLGMQVLNQHLRKNGIELPENTRFDISVDKYGGVTITGLENENMTKAIEEALSYNSQLIISVLAKFVESAKVLDGNPSSTNNGLSVEQQRLIGLQSDLKNYGTDLNDLRLVDSKIQELPQELYDKIYGDRSSWLNGMAPAQAKWENFNIDRIRDDTVHFLQNGTEHIQAPNISLIYDNGRMAVNNEYQTVTINENWIVKPVHSYENQVTYTREGSYQIELGKMLEGKARNASLVAFELVNALSASLSMSNDSTIAECAATREAAFISALHIAEKYFDIEEAKGFIELVTKIKDEDILREKGWVFPRWTSYVNGIIEHNTAEPFRNYSAPGMGNDYISPVGTARYLGAPEAMLSGAQHMVNGTQAVIDFINGVVAGQSFSSQSSALNWDANLRQEIFDAWLRNEKEATEIIFQTVSNFDEDFGNNFLQRILK